MLGSNAMFPRLCFRFPQRLHRPRAFFSHSALPVHWYTELGARPHGITTVVSTQPVHTQQQQRRIMPTPEEVVTAFCKAADANDLDGMLALW